MSKSISDKLLGFVMFWKCLLYSVRVYIYYT